MRTCRIASTMAAAVVAMTFLSAALAGAQDRPSDRMTTYELTLKDGSRLYGTIEQEDDTSIVFRSVAGVVITTARASRSVATSG
jgi:predicted secreted Zn-dependent protease